MINKKNNIVLFDLDETLLASDTEGEWIHYMDENNLIKDESFSDKKKEFDRQYREGEFDIFRYLEFLLCPLKGFDLLDLKVHISVFSSEVIKKLADDFTYQLLEKHKHDLKIISSGALSFLVQDIGRRLGVDMTFGSEPELIQNKFTGRVKSPNFSDEKVRKITFWMAGKQYDHIYAYSDSIHDLPLLEFADTPSVVSPDKMLRKVAKDRNWSIYDRTGSFYS